MTKEPDKIKITPRNPIVQKAFQREVNTQPQVHKDKNKYTRKIKHKNSHGNKEEE